MTKPAAGTSRMPPVSLQRLADDLGLSKATVSRALNNYDDISSETKRRVREAAEALSYTPSTSARRLALGTAQTVAMVLPGEVSSPFYGEFAASLSGALSALGYDLIIRTETAGDPLHDYVHLIRARKVDAFVLLRTAAEDARVDFLIDQGFPFVTHGRTARLTEHPWFDIDGEAAFVHATRHLLGLGHRRIALITGGEAFYASLLRRRGYRAALAEAGIEVDPDLIFRGDLTAAGGRRAGAAIAALRRPPTAVLCSNDLSALGAMVGLKQGGLAIPTDISLIGYDGIAMGDLSDPPLTTLAHSARHGGSVIAKMLIGRINGDPPERHQILWQAELLRRGTDDPPNLQPNQ